MWATILTAAVSASLGIFWGANHPENPVSDLWEAVSGSVRSLIDKCGSEDEKKPEDEQKA